MKLTHIAVIAALAVASLGVVACGSSDTETTASTTATTTAMTDETIAAVATGNKDLSTLVAALTAADLVTTLEGTGPYTVFAPTDAAFADIQSTVDTLLEPDNKTDLQQVLTYHVVPGTYTAADLTDGQKLKTVEGQDLTVSITDGVVKVNDATVEATDITASNGVVHVINKVLVPPAS
ncbi:MAG: fasciclin domain-containing protein [Solirubrobacteraceae bacterium]|nr:fasciclin domain-containing protein [Solirubrobacteraceae bacterium]MBJ7342356.1 fasciclin domain-containing protein [Solirubrobacteraceae bacterium]